MGHHLLQGGPLLQVQAEHLEGPQGRLAAGPEVDQQAGDDCTVGLDLDAYRVRAQEVATSQDVLEEAEEEFDRPPMLRDIGNDFGRYVLQVGRDPQDAIAGGAGRPPCARPSSGAAPPSPG